MPDGVKSILREKLPACNIRKKSAYFGLTSESAGEKLRYSFDPEIEIFRSTTMYNPLFL